ncbi:hypothetical protein DMN91_006437 [Ooceraea biroi]|uniref:Odorant receptor n=1 Tax=Ooceraea biroi TaxID=2015173 RepID=A0A3L8DNS3_OOCBI|nr:odorant receptor 13a-like [Ooceraea biroi]RLU22057.1 hypothetical protein DMN91_006437 [Ooceraea biroi]
MTNEKHAWPSQYYTIPRLYLSLAGIWPYGKLRNRYMCFVPMFTCCFSVVIPQSLYIINNSLNIDEIFESLPSVIISIIFSFKVANMMINNEKIKMCFETIKADWLSLNTDIEKAILQRQTMYGRHMTIFYTVLMYMTALFYLIKPVIITLLEDEMANTTKSRISGISKLPFLVDYGEKLNYYFYPIMIHCYLGVFAHIFCTIAVDTLYYILVQHVCGIFAIIGHALENINEYTDATDNLHSQLNTTQDDYNKALNCLRRHLHVIEFADLIESMFTKILLISVSLNMICGSICGIRVIMNLSNARDIVAPLAIYVAQLSHMFLQFWQAQFLLDYSIIPYESICRAKWYKTSIKCQKLLLLIMNRTVYPCKITAGKILILSIESFGTVLKTSMSYLTVLRSFQ